MQTRIIDITPKQALELVEQGACFIDVREADEHVLGMPDKAQPVPRAELEQNPGQHISSHLQAVVLICGSGRRSVLAAENLARLGYQNIYNVSGGYQRWCDEKQPVQGNNSLEADFTERYARHLRLPQVGVAGQKKLEQARVVLIGAGGLGSPAAYYLAAAGVGNLILVDNDVVDKSNLQRQILHTDASIGKAKVLSAANTLNALNPRINITQYQTRISHENVDAIVQQADVVIDGSDNFPTRYVLNDACVKLAKPLVYAAVQRFSGQISVFDVGRQPGSSPCYRCLFPEAPNGEDAPNCAEAGVLGVLPGVMGILQATEAIKIILDIGQTLSGRLLQFDALAMRFTELKIPVDPDCKLCHAAKC